MTDIYKKAGCNITGPQYDKSKETRETKNLHLVECRIIQRASEPVGCFTCACENFPYIS